MDSGVSEIPTEELEIAAWADEAFESRPEPDGYPEVKAIKEWLSEKGAPEVEVDPKKDNRDHQVELSGKEAALWRKVVGHYGEPGMVDGELNWSFGLKDGLGKRHGFINRWPTEINKDGVLKYRL